MMSGLTREGTAESVSRDQFLRRGRGEENIHLPCSVDHQQDWQPYPVDTLCSVESMSYGIAAGVICHPAFQLFVATINK